MPEADVQAELATRLAASGPVERELPIPEGSFTPYRTDDPRRPNVIDPQTIGGRAGIGAADLALLSGSSLEVAEVKRGEWPLVVDGERQLENYVQKANQNLPFIEERWAQRRGVSTSISSVRAMPTARIGFPSPLRVGGTLTTTSFCRDGLIAFKAIGGQDSRIFMCGSMQQSPDAVIDSMMSRAELAVDQFVDGQLVPRIDQAIQSISVREALRRMLANPELNQALRQAFGGAADLIDLGGGAGAVIDGLDRLMRGQADQFIRLAIASMKDRVVAEVRSMLKQQLRQTLQATLNALCARAAQLTIEEISSELQRRMRDLTKQLIPVAVVAVAAAVLGEVASAVAEVVEYIAIAVGIVVAAIALWEVAAAIAASAAIGEAVVAIGAFFAQLARALLPLVFA